MTASNILVGISVATLALAAGCASAGQPPTRSEAPTTAQAGVSGERRSVNPFVLTAAEIAAAPSVMNAEDAVRTLRPQFLRTRGSTAKIAGGQVGAGGSTSGQRRRPGQIPSGQPAGSGESGRDDDTQSGRGMTPPEDPGIIVYLDRQRYGSVQTLREIPIATVEEIRFLNVGEANNMFGMGHPHGVIQIVSRRGPAPR
jgi:hypothetical protein